MSDTGLDSGEHLFLCNKNLHSAFCVLEFKCLTNNNTFNPLIKPIIWVLLLFPFIYEKRFLMQGIYLQSPLRFCFSYTASSSAKFPEEHRSRRKTVGKGKNRWFPGDFSDLNQASSEATSLSQFCI